MKIGLKIAPESWVLAGLGLADLVTTIYFIRHHQAAEANPLFARFWHMGLPAFVLAKSACLLGPLAVLEWARRHRPRFVAFAIRSAIAGYVMMYALGCFRLNGPQAQADEVRPSVQQPMNMARFYQSHNVPIYYLQHMPAAMRQKVLNSMSPMQRAKTLYDLAQLKRSQPHKPKP